MSTPGSDGPTIRVSSITPSFNTKRYLRGFLERLPAQTCFEQLEVVLDHNEPDDEEVAWVEEFQQAYPGHLKHRIVRPVDPIGTSMNRCIADASGELVAIWNVDDLRPNDALERQLSVFDDQPETDIVYGDFLEVTSFGSTGGERVRCDGFVDSEFTRSMLLGPFFMFRKRLCERAGVFDEQLRSGADFDLAVRLSFHGKARPAPGIVGYHLNEGLGASTRPGNLQVLERTVIELRYGIFDKVDYSAVPRALRYRIGQLLQGGEWTDVADVVPGYDAMYEERAAEWFAPGLRRGAVAVELQRHPKLVELTARAKGALQRGARALGR